MAGIKIGPKGLDTEERETNVKETVKIEIRRQRQIETGKTATEGMEREVKRQTDIERHSQRGQ